MATSAETPERPLLELDEVGCEYRLGSGARFRAVDGVSLTLGHSEVLGLVGESGCGKSTLLKLLLRFWQKDRGTIA